MLLFVYFYWWWQNMFAEIYNLFLFQIFIHLIKKMCSQQNNIDYNKGNLYKSILFWFCLVEKCPSLWVVIEENHLLHDQKTTLGLTVWM